MNPKIRSLAHLIRDKRRFQRKKCTVLLGAGASMSSGVKPTDAMMEGLLRDYGEHYTGPSLRERFDELWKNTDDDTREMYLDQYMKLEPSSGYLRLAELIRDEYFDRVITFNFDRLLESALTKSGYHDCLVVVRGEYESDEAVRHKMEAVQPRVKILKMHGGLKGGDTFLFNSAEMDQYKPEMRKLFEELTSEDILVCGYSFTDDCVHSAFSRTGGTVYCVDPKPPKRLDPILGKRKSTGWVFEGESGYFDNFFAELSEHLGSPEPAEAPAAGAAQPQPAAQAGANGQAAAGPSPKPNPFKFLLSYDTQDCNWFYGRKQEIQELVAKFKSSPPRVMHLLGSPRVGKTSLVRAGLIPELEALNFFTQYVRCRCPGGYEAALRQALGKVLPGLAADEPIKAAVQRLAESRPNQHVIIVLDQFERVVGCYKETDSGLRQLRNCLKRLGECASRNLSLVCVVGMELKTPLAIFYQEAVLKAGGEFKIILPLSPRLVGPVIGRIARKAGVEFDKEVLLKLRDVYRDQSLSLAHIQAICNMLADEAPVRVARLEEVLRTEKETLDKVLEACDIISFVDDIPDETRRNLFRKVMKVILPESKKVLAAHLQQHFSDVLTPPENAQAEATAAARDGERQGEHGAAGVG
jgi:hypothetical protein